MTTRRGAWVVTWAFCIFLSHSAFAADPSVLSEKTEIVLQGEFEDVSEERDVQASEKDPTVVTSSRADSQGKAARGNTLDEDALKERNARTLADALSQEAGIQLNNNMGLGNSLTVDGLDGKYVLVLVDGKPLTGKVNNRTDLSRLGISASQVS